MTCTRTSDLWRAFAQREAAGASPTYEQIAYAVAADERILTLLDDLPPTKRQPTLLLGVGRLLGAPLSPEAFAGRVVDHWDDGPAPFLTTVDGAPSGWSGRHGQSRD